VQRGGDEEAVDVMSYAYGVELLAPSELHKRSRVAQPRSELDVRSWKMGVPLHHPPSRSDDPATTVLRGWKDM